MLTHEPTENKESKLTMTRKLNDDNGLQDWNTVRPTVINILLSAPRAFPYSCRKKAVLNSASF